MKLVVAIALVLIAQVLIIDRTVLPAAQKDSVTWDAVFAWIQRDWPEVSQMSTRELAQRMAASGGATPLLIDVRTREEYEVSHLPGAIWAETPRPVWVCHARSVGPKTSRALPLCRRAFLQSSREVDGVQAS
jgi:rhodanese-related sulfurtransferase